MANQILQVKDGGGTAHDLGIDDGSGSYALSAHDKATYDTLAAKFGLSPGTAEVVNTSGDNVILTPATGNHFILKWIYLATPSANSAEVIAKVYLGTDLQYSAPLGNPGLFARSARRLGAVDAPLIVNLSGAQNVHVNYELDELT